MVTINSSSWPKFGFFDNMSISKVRPLLRWAGSKQKLIPKLLPYWDSRFDRYVEPFAGSASLFFKINPRKALINDININLINTYRSVRDHPRAVFNRLHKLPLGKENYYKIRKIDQNELSNLDRAARFIYLNRFCFNGIYRTNLSGHFNVPYSSQGTGGLPDADTFFSISNMLKGKRFLSLDFERVLLNRVKSGDFVYMDPPYVVSNRRIFVEYGPKIFDYDDLERLGSSLKKIDKIGAKFVVSYALCKEALNIFKEWDITKVTTQRNVSGFAKHRRRAIEVLVSNI